MTNTPAGFLDFFRSKKLTVFWTSLQVQHVANLGAPFFFVLYNCFLDFFTSPTCRELRSLVFFGSLQLFFATKDLQKKLSSRIQETTTSAIQTSKKKMSSLNPKTNCFQNNKNFFKQTKIDPKVQRSTKKPQNFSSRPKSIQRLTKKPKVGKKPQNFSSKPKSIPRLTRTSIKPKERPLPKHQTHKKSKFLDFCHQPLETKKCRASRSLLTGN